jgi:tetratricopeptide (TPR) repeat protein
LRLETALAQVRLGRIYDIQGLREEAGTAHLESIKQLSLLHNEFEGQPQFQHSLGEAYNWFGEHLRPFDSVRAEAAYNDALALQQDLLARFPDVFDYQYEMARTYNNRGILIASQRDRLEEAEASFDKSIELFNSLRENRGDVLDSLRLARTKNNLAIMLRENGRNAEAESEYNEAIAIMRELVDASPQKREYREGLARMYNNLGNLQLTQAKSESALEANTEARRLFESLSSPIPSLRSEIANSYNTRGQILRKLKRPEEAAQAYQSALQQFEQLAKELPGFADNPELNQRYGNALANLAILQTGQGRFDDGVSLVSRAINSFENAVNSSASSSGLERNLSNAYWLLADINLKAGDYSGAVGAIEILAETAADENTNFRAAVLYARATELVLADSKLTSQQHNEIGEAYQQRTVSLLARAIAGGYSPGDVKANERFAYLQARDDYREIFNNTTNSQE